MYRFDGLDWEALDRFEVTPPWVPKVEDEMDFTHIDSTFTQEVGVCVHALLFFANTLTFVWLLLVSQKATDSPEEPSPLDGAKKDPNFQGFTYQGDSILENA